MLSRRISDAKDFILQKSHSIAEVMQWPDIREKNPKKNKTDDQNIRKYIRKVNIYKENQCFVPRHITKQDLSIYLKCLFIYFL